MASSVRVKSSEECEAASENETMYSVKPEEMCNPFSTIGTASISMAALPSSFTKHVSLLAFNALSPPVSTSLVPMASSKINAGIPSQKKSFSPIPVMSASKVATQDATTAQFPNTFKPSFKNGATTRSTAVPDRVLMPLHGNFGHPSSGGALRKSAIVWFRNDLRVHDNEALAMAHNESLSVLPVFCFDPRDYGKSSSGFDKTGPYRAKFLLECVSDLRNRLRARGSDLVVRMGKPEEVLPELARATGASAVYAHQEVTQEEVSVENTVCNALQEQGVETKMFWGSTLYHVEDLPFASLEDMPANYGGFKEKTANVEIRGLIELPEKLKPLPSHGRVEAGAVPSMQELGVSPANSSAGARQESKSGSDNGLLGGESEALRRLTIFVQEARAQARQPGKESLMGANFSCKISPWLATGCLSPRRMYQDLKKEGSVVASVEGKVDEKSGLNWLVFELLWRDFFRFITKKYGATTQKSPPVPAAACFTN